VDYRPELPRDSGVRGIDSIHRDKEYVQIVIRNAEVYRQVYDPIKTDQTHQTMPKGIVLWVQWPPAGRANVSR